MIKKLKEIMIFCVIILLFISCTKDVEPVIPSESDQTETPNEENIVKPDEETETSGEESIVPEEESKNPAETANSVVTGTGSGDLTIDGNDTKVKGKNLIIIKSGTYNNISIKNIDGDRNSPVLIKNDGQVTIRGEMNTDNITNLTIAGDNAPGIKFGFNFNNIPYRAIVMNGKMSGVTLKSLSFKNVKDYVIFGGNLKQSYQGNESTRVERFKILNCKFDNAGGIFFGGNLGSNEDIGFVKDLEIAHNIFENTSWGNIVQFSNVQDYNVHHNIVNNVNTNNDQHNGIFLMIGNGKFHNNKFTNYQGNMIRAWVYSRGNTPSTVEIHNNIAYNTRKYGAFELQGFDRYIVPGKSTHVNAKVYNNTVGKMNTSKDWEGVILDLLNYGGTLEYYNNLGFDLNHSKSVGDMINNYSDVKIIKNDNNKYFSSSSEAVMNLTDFKSKHAGIGSNL